jgi:predicted nucleic-acid-binding protein
MIAVDTNVVVRLLTKDDLKQTAAESLFAVEPIWIAKTVLLETIWVLRSLYGFDEGATRGALELLLGLKTCTPRIRHPYRPLLAFRPTVSN